jgi:hypothetical protein
MDVQISQTTAAYHFWAEHVQYCLIWEDITWFGQIQNVQKYNLPNFEYYLKLEVAACGNSDLSCFWCAHHV